MKRLNDKIIRFFQDQGFTVVSTIDEKLRVHNSCKGIIKITRSGLVYLLDLYWQQTYKNLTLNSSISITAVDEQKFAGYCLKGKAKIVSTDKIKSGILKAWEKKITGRITRRVIDNLHGEKAHFGHPEALLPKPAYIVVMEVEEIVDLTPSHIK